MPDRVNVADWVLAFVTGRAEGWIDLENERGRKDETQRPCRGDSHVSSFRVFAGTSDYGISLRLILVNLLGPLQRVCIFR